MSLVDRGKIYGGAFDGDLRPAIRRDKNQRYVFEAFKSLPIYVDDDGDGAPTGTAGEVSIMRTDRNAFEYVAKGDNQTILKHTWAATGLDVGGDQAANEGWEITQGITSRSRGYFTVGTDASFFFALTFAIEDVSGTDDCFVGFRKAEAYQANLDDYDEMAGLNVISGDINIETILNGGTTSTTDTTDDWANAASKTLGVYVDSDGAVTYKIDGVAPTTTATFSFDSTETVVPCFFFLHAADLAGYMRLTQWECGFSSAILYP